MGLNPGTTRADVRKCLERWNEGDNGILYHSRAYKLKPGTGWQIDAGILHAPGSLVTYEPQVNSDVFAMFQSLVEGRGVPWDLLVKDVPEEHHHDLEYLLDMMDWDAKRDPEFAEHRLFDPKPVCPVGDMAEHGYCENWVVYSTAHYSAKELTVFPGTHRNDSGRSRIRDDSGAGLRPVRQAPRRDSGSDPLRPDDAGRVLRQRRHGAQRNRRQKQERDREHGFLEALRPRQSASANRAKLIQTRLPADVV